MSSTRKFTRLSTHDVKENVPEELRDLPQWLLWQEIPQQGKKPRKVPRYTDGGLRRGRLGTDADRSRLVTFDEALKAFELDSDATGIGLALMDGIAAFDLDECLTGDGHVNSGELTEAVVEYATRWGCYIEVSPSGTGLRIIGPSDTFYKYSKDGLEYWGRDRFVTVTGDVWANSKGWRDMTDIRALLGSDTPAETQLDEDDEAAWLTPKTEKKVREALAITPADEYELWIRFGMVLCRFGDKGFRLWDEWSRKSNKYDEVDTLRRWETFTPRGEVNLGSIFYEADQYKSEAQQEEAKQIFQKQFMVENLEHEPIEYVLDGFMGRGFSLISGTHGAGKTSSLIPLFASVAHLSPSDWGFHPELRRRVVWITEAPEQSMRILKTVLRQNEKEPDFAEVNHWFAIVPAHRAEPETWAATLAEFRTELTYQHASGYEVEPVFIFDTAAANLDLEDENSNSEVSKAVAKIRQALPGANLVIIGHTPKSGLSTMRGASAWEADSEGVYILDREEETGVRFLEATKVRFTTTIEEVHFGTIVSANQALTGWGTEQHVNVAAGLPEPGTRRAREDARNEAREERRDSQADESRQHRHAEILEVIRRSVTEPVNEGRPVRLLSQRDIRGVVRGNNDAILVALNELTDAGEIIPYQGRKRSGGRPGMFYAPSDIDVTVLNIHEDLVLDLETGEQSST